MFLTFLRSAIRFSTVFLFGSTGETITEKSGNLNLGIPGIMCVGAVGGCVGERIYLDSLASVSQANGFAAVFIPIIFSMLFAGMLGLLYSFMTVTLHCNQNVTGLTITTFGVGFAKFLGDGIDKTGFSQVSLLYFQKGISTSGDWFSTIFLSHGTLVYLAIIVAIITAVVIKKTRVGLSLRAVGESPATADAVGINVSGYKYTATILGSAIAGLGGLFYIMDYTQGAWVYDLDAVGWLAVALVIFSVWKPNWGILGSIVFGAFYIMPYMGLTTNTVASEAIKILPYAVTVIVLIITSIINKRESQPPAALGTSYFREER